MKSTSADELRDDLVAFIKFVGPDINVPSYVIAGLERHMAQETADAFRKCRAVSGLGVVEYGWAIGYRGTPNTISRLIRSFESGEKVPPTYIQNLIIMYWRHGIPDEFLSPQALETRRARGLAK